MREFNKERAGLVLLGCLVLGAGGYFAFGGSGAKSATVVTTVAPVRKAGPQIALATSPRKPPATPDRPIAGTNVRPEPQEDPTVNSGRPKRPHKKEPEKMKTMGPCG